MKKTTFIFLGLFTLAFIVFSSFIHNDPHGNMMRDNTSEAMVNEITDDIPVEEFNSIAIALDAEIFIEQGNAHSLEIETSSETLDKIEVKVKDGKLVIKPENNTSRLKDDIRIYIVAPDYETISLAGSGELFAEKKMELEDTEFKLAGSGSMIFEDLSADELELKISGSGEVQIQGEGTEEMDISIAGSGDVDCADFPVEELNAKISGSGDCKVWVNGEINAFIAGSGSIHYKGNPQIDSSVAGSGSVKSL